MHEPRAVVGAARGEPLHRTRVDRERAVLLALADLDVVERRAVEDDRRPHVVEHGANGGVVGDVEVGAGRRDDLRIAAKLRLEVGGELARRRR